MFAFWSSRASSARTRSQLVAQVVLQTLERRTFLSAGDTFATATPVAISHTPLDIAEAIGDEPSGGLDVDIFKITVNANDRIVIGLDSFDAIVRLFDSGGNLVTTGSGGGTGPAIIDPVGTGAGDYYVAISGSPNYSYDPGIAQSGNAGATGPYHLNLSLNQTPLANDFLVTARLGQPTKINALAHATDADGDPISLSLNYFGLEGNGAVSINNNGTPANPQDDYLSYQSGPLETGTSALIRYTVSDGREDSYTFGTITVALTGAQIGTDVATPSQQALYVLGTAGDDIISVKEKKVGKLKRVEPFINGQSQGVFDITPRLIVYGQLGNDTISVADGLAASTFEYGGPGNDILKGTNGSDVLIGNDPSSTFYDPIDADHLYGYGGRDVLIGGPGADSLDGGADDDILIAGFSSLAAPANSADIMNEWTRTNQSYQWRVQHLLHGGGLNSQIFYSYNVANYDDYAADQIVGGGGNDFFVADSNGSAPDHLLDQKKDEFIFELA